MDGDTIIKIERSSIKNNTSNNTNSTINSDAELSMFSKNKNQLNQSDTTFNPDDSPDRGKTTVTIIPTVTKLSIHNNKNNNDTNKNSSTNTTSLPIRHSFQPNDSPISSVTNPADITINNLSITSNNINSTNDEHTDNEISDHENITNTTFSPNNKKGSIKISTKDNETTSNSQHFKIFYYLY
jgi:hypothetical protein